MYSRHIFQALHPSLDNECSIISPDEEQGCRMSKA